MPVANPFPQGHKFVHHSEYRVIYRDTDLAGHVYYGNYLTFFEVGRGAYLRDLGANYRDWEARGYMMPVRSASAEYLKSALYDDVLTIETSLAGLTPVQIAFSYRILRDAPGEDGGFEVLCEGRTRHPFLRQDRTISRDGLKLMGEVGVRPQDIPPELRKIAKAK